MTWIGFLYSRTCVEEKLLLEEMERRRDLKVVCINDSERYFDISQLPVDVDVVFERSISYSHGLYVSRLFEAHGVPVVNPSVVAERCGDKYVTSQILVRSGIPTPRVLMAFGPNSVRETIESLGYPCVLNRWSAPGDGCWRA